MDTDTTKQFSWKTAILLLLTVGLLSAGLSVFIQAWQVRSETATSSAAGASAVFDSAPAAGSASTFDAPAMPVRLKIPAIGVDAAIQSVGLAWAAANKGDMGVPTNFTDVAWYNGGPRPGMLGSAVIDGHLDGRYIQQAVFYNIGNLKPGDLVEVVDATGKTLQFNVVRTAIYDYLASTTDIFSGDTSKARLNLITCAGDWLKSQQSYDKRIVVFTELAAN
jgi:sortase (surface protein transpeptidase)